MEKKRENKLRKKKISRRREEKGGKERDAFRRGREGINWWREMRE